jgi:hypothetical protein
MLALLVLSLFIFVDKFVLSKIQVAGLAGIEFYTTTILLATLVYGVWTVPLLALIVFPLIDVLLVFLYKSDPPNPIDKLFDVLICIPCALLFIFLLGYFPFSIAFVVAAFFRKSFAELKGKYVMGGNPNPISFVGNAIFIYAFALLIEKYFLRIFI